MVTITEDFLKNYKSTDLRGEVRYNRIDDETDFTAVITINSLKEVIYARFSLAAGKGEKWSEFDFGFWKSIKEDVLIARIYFD